MKTEYCLELLQSYLSAIKTERIDYHFTSIDTKLLKEASNVAEAIAVSIGQDNDSKLIYVFKSTVEEICWLKNNNKTVYERIMLNELSGMRFIVQHLRTYYYGCYRDLDKMCKISQL